MTLTAVPALRGMALGSAIMICAAAHADEPLELDEIVVEDDIFTDTPAGPVNGWQAVTGNGVTRTGTPIERVPQSVQILPERLLTEQNAQSVQDALRNVPGVTVSQDNELFLNAPIIRGFEARSYFDGQPSFGFTNSFDPLTTIHIERVEVIKGPSGTLFGGGTGAPLGGIINLIRKRPEPDGIFGSVVVSGGSFGNLGVGGDVNVPLTENGRIRFRMQGEVRIEDSFIDDVESEQLSIFPALEIDLTEKTTLSILGTWSARNFVEYPGLPTQVLNLSGIDERQFPGSLNPPESYNRSASALVLLDHEVEPGWTVHASLQYLSDEFVENDSFADGAFFDINPNDTLFPVITGQLTNDVTQFTGNIWTVLDFKTGPATHKLLIGAEADHTAYDGTTSFQFTGDVLDIANPVRPTFQPLTIPPGSTADIENTSFSLYLQDEVTLFDRLHLLGSVRWTRLTTDDSSVAGDTTVNEITVRGGAVFDLTDDFSIFAGYGEGFQQVLFFNPSFPGDTPEPETSVQLEAGLRWNFDDRLTGSLAGFQVTRRNVPVIVSTPGNAFGQIQSGEQRARGIEAELLWQPMPALSVLANYTFTNARVTEDTTLPVGDKLNRVPRHQGRIAAQYRFLRGPAAGFSVGAGLTAASGAEVTLPNTVRTRPFAVVDARVGYDFGRAEVILSVENLLNEEYYVPYGFFNSTVAAGEPRTVFATIRAKF